MFHDLDETLGAVLDDANAPAELRNADVSFQTPEKTFAPSEATVNLFLYEVRENRELRDPVPIVEQTGGAYTSQTPPMRVDCSYLVTAWSSEAGPAKVVEEHRLLGQALLWLSRFPAVPAEHLRGGLVGQPFPVPLAVGAADGGKNLGEFWSALGRPPRPAFHLTVTVAMSVFEPEPLGPVVITKRLVVKEI